MEERTNYGKIIAVTLAVISAASAIAFVIYRLLRNLITFCSAYDEEELDEDILDFDELDEELDVTEEAEPQDEEPDAPTAEATEE
ncbi:MAG: hypothetical protein E7663_05425 [Ruminococcaceae bacterium]|nr:hypothetical protein [Oscillospiraceae bacterium]